MPVAKVSVYEDTIVTLARCENRSKIIKIATWVQTPIYHEPS